VASTVVQGKEEPRGKARVSSPSPKGAQTWHATTFVSSPAGFRVIDYWSKGDWMRANTLISGHPITTLVRGDRYVVFDALTGEANIRIPADGGGGGRDTAVPPRPVEITWPETKGLGHCLGLEIAIRIEVDKEGEVLQVKAVDAGHPPDCTKAALDAARLIRFRPGLVKGRPARMWTQLRIDFRRKS